MYFLLSGEGSADIGRCAGGENVCEGEDFRYGPMAKIADQVVEKRHGYSMLETGCCGYVSEKYLAQRAGELKAAKKPPAIPGKKRGKETRYFFANARVLARIAKQRQTERNDLVVAILFRDADGTASAGRGLWEEKRASMLLGFDEEGFTRGVPMLPKPKSEAWLICALKNAPYENCDVLERRSGNDNSPNSLKAELTGILGDVALVETLCEMLEDRTIDIDRIDMLSFRAFRQRLEEVI